MSQYLILVTAFYIFLIEIWFKLGVLDGNQCRLAGAALIAPVVNYWWPGFPSNLSTEYYKQPVADQWALRVAHHIPWLTYWWNTQKFFPSSSVADLKPEVFSPQDLEIFANLSRVEKEKYLVLISQSEAYSIIWNHRKTILTSGNPWDRMLFKQSGMFVFSNCHINLWYSEKSLTSRTIIYNTRMEYFYWCGILEWNSKNHLVFACYYCQQDDFLFFFSSMQPQVRQQGEFESIHRDLMIGFGKWEFDPMDLKNPFSNDEGSVHIWMGEEDRLVPVTLLRYIANKLPWIHYHEIPGSGHFFPYINGMSEAILKALLVQQK